jgi:HSP20 family protein
MNSQLNCTDEVRQPAELAERVGNRPTYTPRADIYDSENNIIVLADLPGADESTIDVTVEKNTLSIRAHAEFMAPEQHTLTYSEYAVGNYERHFTLPNEIDKDGITATMKNGVLRLVLPKSDQSKLKKIEVRSE